MWQNSQFSIFYIYVYNKHQNIHHTPIVNYHSLSEGASCFNDQARSPCGLRRPRSPQASIRTVPALLQAMVAYTKIDIKKNPPFIPSLTEGDFSAEKLKNLGMYQAKLIGIYTFNSVTPF